MRGRFLANALKYVHRMKRLLDTHQLAAELNRPIRQIRGLVQAKKIPVLKIGWRTNLFDPDAVLKALARFEIKEIGAKAK